MIFFRKYQVIAGILLILALLVWIWPEANPPPNLAKKNADGRNPNPLVSSSRGNNSAKPSRPRRHTSVRVVNPIHEVKDLIDFYHPAIDLEGDSLIEAMSKLFALYHKICVETGETVLPLTWEIRGHPVKLGRIRLEGSFLNSCRKLALFSRMTFTIEGRNLVFEEIEPGSMVEQAWTVPPTFQEALPILLGMPSTENADPFAPGNEEQRELGLQAQLRESGILGADETLDFEISSGRVTVTGREGTTELINSLVRIISAERPVQIRYAAYQENQGNWDPLPTLVTLPGQRATMEMVTEIPYSPDGQNFDTITTGTRMTIDGELYGFGERTTFQYSHTDEPSGEQMAAFSQSGRIEDLELQSSRLETEPIVSTVSDRGARTLYEISNHQEAGDVRIRFFGERIDATGRRIEGPIHREDTLAVREINDQDD
jgi:hypothetical protein